MDINKKIDIWIPHKSQSSRRKYILYLIISMSKIYIPLIHENYYKYSITLLFSFTPGQIGIPKETRENLTIRPPRNLWRHQVVENKQTPMNTFVVSIHVGNHIVEDLNI